MKKTSLFTIVLLLCLATDLRAYDIKVGDFYYNYINNSTELEVTHDGTANPACDENACYKGDMVIPEEVTILNRTRKVTRIASGAFSHCHDLTSIFVPKSVQIIDRDAFLHCDKLKGVYISDMEAWCKIAFYTNNSKPFANSYKLYLNDELVTDLVIPNTITVIRSYSFRGCTSLKSVTIGDGVKIIDNEAFAECTSLEDVTIGKSVTDIGSDAFLNCEGIQSIHISDLNAWCYIDFGNAASNPLSNSNLYVNNERVSDLVIPNTVINIKQYAFYHCKDIKTVTLPSWVGKIGVSAFEGCGLNSIVIPNTVTSIGNNAFKGCQNLESATIGNCVNSIGDFAFSGCTSLADIYFDKIRPCSISANVFDDLNYYNSTLYVHSEAKYNFKSTNYWSKFVFVEELPLEITEVLNVEHHDDGTATLLGLHNGFKADVEKLVIPEKITVEGKEYSLTEIADKAFLGNSVLTSITIPKSVTHIGNLAFHKCENLKSFVVDNANPYYTAQDFILYSKDKTKLLDKLKNDTELFTIPEQVMYIESNAFLDCNKLVMVTVPEKVSYIGYGAFQNCSGLIVMIMKSNIPPTLGTNCFMGSTYASAVLTVPMQSVEKYKTADVWREWGTIKYQKVACGMCGDNVQYEIDETGMLRIWGSGEMTITPWQGYSNEFTRIKIEEGVTNILKHSFLNCQLCRTVSIPSSVASIGERAFQGCKSLTTINVDSENMNYTAVDCVLYDKKKTSLIFCPNTKKGALTVPRTVTSIEPYAFYECKNIESIEINSDVISIGSYAFYGCTVLKDMHCWTQSVPQLGENVFEGVPLASGYLYVKDNLIDSFKSVEQWQDWGKVNETYREHEAEWDYLIYELFYHNDHSYYDLISDNNICLLNRSASEKFMYECHIYLYSRIKQLDNDLYSYMGVYYNRSETKYQELYEEYSELKAHIVPFKGFLIPIVVTAIGDGEVKVYENTVRNESKTFYYLCSKELADFIDIKIDTQDMYDYGIVSVFPDEGCEVESFVDGQNTIIKDTSVKAYGGSYTVTFSSPSGIDKVEAPASKKTYYTISGIRVPDISSAKGIIIVNDGKKARKVLVK